jgi:uncharacterized protein YhaN
MRLWGLEIENFGIFSGHQLQFGPGFQLIYGENEAGKSTLLQLIREVLFGFRNQYDGGFQRHKGEMAASALIELADGTQVRFRRRKGRKSTVVGQVTATGEPVGQDELSRMLGRASVELYRHLFAFSLSELSSGEESLAHANLNEALYGVGIGGLANIQRALAALEAERQSLFSRSKRATNPTINELLRKIRQDDEKLRKEILRPRDFESITSACSQAEAAVAETAKQREELRRREAKWRRVSQALPPWRKREEAKRELATLAVPLDFPLDALDEYHQCRERLRETEREVAGLTAELEASGQQLESMTFSPEMIAHEVEIKHLYQQIGKIEAFRRDLPLRRQDALAMRSSVKSKLQVLNPDWGFAHLDQFQSSLARRELFESMRRRWEELEGRKSQLVAQRPALITDVTMARQRVEELSGILIVPALDELVRRQPQYEADREKLRDLDEQLCRVRAELTKLRSRLDAPLQSPLINAEKLPVPMEATVNEFRQRLATLVEAVARHEQRVEEAQSDGEQKRRLLAALSADEHVPAREDLMAQRARRDEGWQLIRQNYVRGKPDAERITRWLVDPQDSLPDAYEREVATADEIADRRQANAELVAKQEQLVAEVEQAERRVAAAKEQLAERRSEGEEALDDWKRLWASCGVQPLAPEAMLEWLRCHGQLLDKLEQESVLEVQRRDLEARIGDFEDELRDALSEANQSPGRLLAEACRKVQAAREAAAQRQTYQAQLPAKEAELERLGHELDQLTKQRVLWDEQWRAILAEANFPQEWDVHIATKILHGLGEARQEYAQALAYEQRVADMQRELGEFENQVQSIVHEIATDLVRLPAEDGVAELNRRLEADKQTARDRLKLEKDNVKLQGRLEAKRQGRMQWQERIDRLMRLAAAGNEQQFHQVADAAAKRDRLTREIETLSQNIDAIRGSEPKAEFDTLLDQADPDSIAAQLGQVAAEIAAVESDYRAANEVFGVRRNQLNSLDGTSESLALQMALEGTRAQLVSAVDRWAPLVLAEWLIKQALARFERQHQPEMLREVKRLFGRLTCGRYTDIRRKLDERGTLLVQQEDGALKEPHQLSRGTREQLYLAIRLAYVHHYSRHSEPLPLVMDDVLVNFDDERARHTLEVLWEVAGSLQILFLTCHQGIVELITSARPDIVPIHLEARAREGLLVGSP